MSLRDTDLSAAALSPDGTRLLTAAYDGHFTLWDCLTGRPLRRWHRPIARSGMRWSPDGTLVAFRSYTPMEGGNAYTVTALDPATGEERLAAELDPDDGGDLGFDWLLDGSGLVFADTREVDSDITDTLNLATLHSDGTRRELRRDDARPAVTLHARCGTGRVHATAAGVLLSDAATLVDDAGALVLSPAHVDGQHFVSPARNALVTIPEGTSGRAYWRAPGGAAAAVTCELALGNACAWSRDGRHHALNTALPTGAGYVVFRGLTQVATVPDAQPYVFRAGPSESLFYVPDWLNVALDGVGARFVLADNEKGELRAWTLGAPSTLTWRADLDDLSYVMWNGPVIVAASASQVMFVDGATGAVLARGDVQG